MSDDTLEMEARTAPSEPTPQTEDTGHGARLLRDLLARPAAEGASRATVGNLCGVSQRGELLFRPAGSTADPVPVTIACDVSDEALAQAANQGARALAIRATGADGWVIVGLIREQLAPKADERPAPQVTADGSVLRLSAEKEIELRCGQASLLLRSDGRVLLKGAYIVSSSTGPNKIRGAIVALN